MTTQHFERWMAIPGYEGRYEISDQGRLRSHVLYRGSTGPRLIRTSPGGRGYLLAHLYDAAGTSSTVPVHRAVLASFVGPLPGGMEIRHLDGDRLNNSLANLAYGTKSENVYDRVRHGTHHNAKKTECKRGHAFDVENTRIQQGRRRCRACQRSQDQLRRASAA